MFQLELDFGIVYDVFVWQLVFLMDWGQSCFLQKNGFDFDFCNDLVCYFLLMLLVSGWCYCRCRVFFC